MKIGEGLRPHGVPQVDLVCELQPGWLRQQPQLRHQAYRVLIVDQARQLAVLPLVNLDYI